MARSATARVCSVVVEVAKLPIRLQFDDSDLFRAISERYSGFLSSSTETVAEFEIELKPPGMEPDLEDLRVRWDSGRWLMERSDFQAQWNPQNGLGRVRQAPGIYPLDCVLRIVHTLVMARMQGFLLHASSSIRAGAAYLFSGPEGIGKSATVKSALSETLLLGDDVSCVVRRRDSYRAVGSPFYCGLGRPGANLEAPIKGLYLLTRGSENKVEPVQDAVAVRRLLENILFFANDRELVKSVFETACEFVSRVPVRQLTLVPNAAVWDLVQ